MNRCTCVSLNPHILLQENGGKAGSKGGESVDRTHLFNVRQPSPYLSVLSMWSLEGVSHYCPQIANVPEFLLNTPLVVIDPGECTWCGGGCVSVLPESLSLCVSQ